MKIGVRAHDYGKQEIEVMAQRLHEEGYDAAQLALPKAFRGIERYEDITERHLERIRTAFEKWKIEIPVFGKDIEKMLILQQGGRRKSSGNGDCVSAFKSEREKKMVSIYAGQY